jgi:hypothetical protein
MLEEDYILDGIDKATKEYIVAVQKAIDLTIEAKHVSHQIGVEMPDRLKSISNGFFDDRIAFLSNLKKTINVVYERVSKHSSFDAYLDRTRKG